jgi:hypothetical protein
MFHPVNHFAVKHLSQSDVRHRGCRRRAVPVPFARLERDGVTGAGFLDPSTVALHAPAPGSDDQRLTEWMCQAVRAPGSKLTVAPPMRAGACR